VSFKYIGFVAAWEHVVKRRSFLSRASWVKHAADLPRWEKALYLRKFPERFSKLREFLEYVRWFNDLNSCNNLLERLSPAILIVDPKLHPYINYPRKIPEDRVSRRYEKVLALLADNIAYYAYWATEIRKKPQLVEQILK